MLRFVVLLISIVLAQPAFAQAKRALIIGNAGYSALPVLATPLNEAAAYAETFQGLGFAVTKLENLDRLEMEDALAAFYEEVQSGDTVAFVYSGHGWSDQTENYLIPTDAELEQTESQMRARSISLQNRANGVLDRLAERNPSFVLAIIDACRDNPISSNSRSIGLTRGLTAVEPTRGSVVIFSASPNQRALDRLQGETGQTELSVFSRNFVPGLQRGITVEDAFFEARAQTAKLAAQQNYEQRPVMFADTIEKNCLRDDGPCEGPVATAEEAPRKGPLPLTIIVDPDGNGHYPDLASAIEAAAPDWIIELKPGEYAVPSLISRKVQITGQADRGAVVLSNLQSGQSGILQLSGDVQMSNLTLAGNLRIINGSSKLTNVAVIGRFDNVAVDVTKGSLTADGLYIKGGSDGMRIIHDHTAFYRHQLRNLQISDVTKTGLFVGAYAKVEVTGAEISNTDRAILVVENGDLVLADSRIFGNKTAALEFGFGSTGLVLKSIFQESGLNPIYFHSTGSVTIAQSTIRDGELYVASPQAQNLRLFDNQVTP